jgi:F0F1-type ATP synthase assembly protein I
MVSFGQVFLVLVGILVNIAIVNPYFILLMILLGFCYYGVTAVYLRTSRNVKRLEAISKSSFNFKLAKIANEVLVVTFWLMTKTRLNTHC